MSRAPAGIDPSRHAFHAGDHRSVEMTSAALDAQANRYSGGRNDGLTAFTASACPLAFVTLTALILEIIPLHMAPVTAGVR